MDAARVIGKEVSVNQIHSREHDSLLCPITKHLLWFLSYYSFSSCSCLASGTQIKSYRFSHTTNSEGVNDKTLMFLYEVT